MQMFSMIEQEDFAAVGWAVPVLLLSSDGEDGPIAQRLAGLGGKVAIADELFAALSEVIDDPAGYALFVVDCEADGVGGLEAAQRALHMLGGAITRVPVVLVSKECRQQQFPAERGQPTVLRAPLSAVSLKVGFEHALRDRLAYRAA